jgi:hypothetical protein
VSIGAGKTLTSASENDVIRLGSNLAMLGNEIIQFANVQFAGAWGSQNRYVLKDLLRGRFGTEHEITTHPPGTEFLLLTESSLRRVSWPLADIDEFYFFKGVSEGQIIDNVFPKGFVNAGGSLKPWSPAQIEAVKGANGDWVIRWRRRTRFNGQLRDEIDLPLNEDIEEYQLFIFNGATLVRSVTGLTENEYTYTDANQVTDFGATQTSLVLNIHQSSTSVTRGFFRQVTLDPVEQIYPRNDA